MNSENLDSRIKIVVVVTNQAMEISSFLILATVNSMTKTVWNAARVNF